MKYDFDSVINRRGTGSVKWDDLDQRFGSEDVLPLWVADMDFKSPQPVIDAIKSAADHGVFGYSKPTHSYYDSVKAWMKRRHGWDIKEEWITLTPGVVPALHVLTRTFTKPGDEVVVQTPAYHPFFHVIENNGRTALLNPLTLSGGRYTMDLDDLERRISPRTSMALLCSPHNPVGRVWSPEELAGFGEVCARHNILIIADEIHHDLVLPGFRHVPFAPVVPDIASGVIVCTAASKTFNLPGLHTSNILIRDARLRERFCSALSLSGIGSANTFGIVATEAAYRHGEDWLEQLLDYLAGNIEFAVSFARERIPGLRVVKPEGTYLVWLDFRETAIPEGRLDTFLRTSAKVGLNIGTMFRCQENGFARMNIGCPRSTLEDGLRRIETAISRL